MRSFPKFVFKPIQILIAIFILCISCSQSIREQSTVETGEKDEYQLENLFFYTIEELENKFGKTNVQTEFFEACETCGPEGTPSYEDTYRTTLFPNTDKEAVLYWNSNQTMITEVSVSLKGNKWRTKEGFRLGDGIDKINRYYSSPVKLLYVNWFYYQKNESCVLNFSSDDLNFDNLDTENLYSNDPRVKNLVLVSISLRIPGYQD